MQNITIQERSNAVEKGGVAMDSWAQAVASFVIVEVAVLLVGCAEPPTTQLEAAAKAVESARAAEAPKYAKEDFVALEQQLALARDELAKQGKILSIFRSYTEADKILTKVVEAGKQVETKATANKETAKTAAVTMEKEAQQIVVSARELVRKAPVGKERAAVNAIKQDLDSLKTGLTGLHQLIEKGDYLEAEAQAKALKEKGTAVSTEIREAIGKVKKSKGSNRHVS
jgi:hypothetical protein